MRGGAYAGLLPLFVALVLFGFGQWGPGLAVYVAGNLLVVGGHLARRESVGSLEAVSLALAVVLAALYVATGNIFVLQHFGVVVNAVLLVQIIIGEVRGEPWTAQFARDRYPPEQWRSRAFIEGNRFVSRLWGAVFVISILMAALGTTPLVLFVIPNVLLVVALAVGPRLGAWYGRRFVEIG